MSSGGGNVGLGDRANRQLAGRLKLQSPAVALPHLDRTVTAASSRLRTEMLPV